MSSNLDYKLLLHQIKGFMVKEPTIVAGSDNLKNICHRLARDLHTKDAFIIEEDDYFGKNKSLVLCGHINPNAVLLIDRRTTDHSKNSDIYDLVMCAGAKKVYIKEVTTTKPLIRERFYAV